MGIAPNTPRRIYAYQNNLCPEDTFYGGCTECGACDGMNLEELHEKWPDEYSKFEPEVQETQ